MTYAYGSSGSFGSRVRSKSIGNNTYTVRRSNFLSKYYFNYSYSISHFNILPQVVAKNICPRELVMPLR